MARIEDVAVPTGKYLGAVAAEVTTRNKDGVVATRTVWYVKDVGPVKMVTKDAKGKVEVYELVRFVTAPKG